MPLKIQGSVVVDAPREDVYNLLLDPEVLKQVIGKIPGITLERLEKVSDTEYDGAATIGVAMVKGTYNGKITILDRRPGEYIKMHADGKGGGNWTSGEAELTLVQQDGQTVMNYLGQGNVSGQLASVGQRLVDTVGRQFVDQGAKAFAEEIASRRREQMGIKPVAPAPARQWVPNWAFGTAAAVAFGALVVAALYFGLRR